MGEHPLKKLALADPELARVVKTVLDRKKRKVSLPELELLVEETLWGVSQEINFGRALAKGYADLAGEVQPDKIDEALRLAQLAYERQPSNAAIADTLGWIYFKKHMPRRSEWMLKQAQSIVPENPEVLRHNQILQKAIQCTLKPDGGTGGVTSGKGSPPPPPEESGKNSPSNPSSF